MFEESFKTKTKLKDRLPIPTLKTCCQEKMQNTFEDVISTTRWYGCLDFSKKLVFKLQDL